MSAPHEAEHSIVTSHQSLRAASSLAEHIIESKMHDDSQAGTVALSQWRTVRDFAEFIADKALQEVFDLKLLELPSVLKLSELPRKSFMPQEAFRTSLSPLLEEV